MTLEQIEALLRSLAVQRFGDQDELNREQAIDLLDDVQHAIEEGSREPRSRNAEIRAWLATTMKVPAPRPPIDTAELVNAAREEDDEALFNAITGR
jgi:hypothetical protein